MDKLRELIKQSVPTVIRDVVKVTRSKLAAPPLENIVLHEYEIVVDSNKRKRLNLVIPSISPAKAFGGILTGLEVFLEIGKRTGADLRIFVDDFDRHLDCSLVEKLAADMGLKDVEIVARTAMVPILSLRAADVFLSFNWWTVLNIRPVLRAQCIIFGVPARPHLYLLQDYEPSFFPFSSTLMMAQLALQPRWPSWGIFNSNELYNYCLTRGHQFERAFVFEPRLSSSLRVYLEGPAPSKERRILIYGRPSIQRNCFPAIERGLRLWATRYSELDNWEVISAGTNHPDFKFAKGRTMVSVGKLSLSEYGELLRKSAVGLSLMCSPHPSYPPLEMAHFGLLTITNSFANKDLSSSHQNIVSVDDIGADTLAEALCQACSKFDANPTAGWAAPSGRLSFLEVGPFGFLDEISERLNDEVWSDNIGG